MTRPAMSVQLYSVRDDLAADPAGTLRRLADLGLRTVEPYGLVDNVDALAAPLADLGLSAPTTHASVVDADLDTLFDAANRVGVGLVVEPFIPAEYWTTRDDIARTADALNAAAARAAEHGLAIGYHNHQWELAQRVDDVTGLELLVSMLDDAVRLEVDTYWVAVGGEDPADLLRRLGPRVAALHVKDGPITEDIAQQLPAGEGRMPIEAVLAAAPDALPVLEFDEYAGDLYEGLATSKATLERLGVTA